MFTKKLSAWGEDLEIRKLKEKNEQKKVLSIDQNTDLEAWASLILVWVWH